MATISTAIELNDNFTGVLNNIVNAMNMTVSVMEQMQGTMNDPVDPSTLDGIRNYANQATMAVQELTAALGTVEPPAIPTPSAPEWQSDTMDVFTNTGVERFEQEVQSANNMLNTLNQTQAHIAEIAAQTNIFPPNMVTDMNGMQTRLQAIQQRIQAIENNPLNMGSDMANAELEQLRGQLDQAVQEQQNLNRAVDNMDVQAANEAYLRLSQTIGNTERYIRDNVTEQGRFNREIQKGVDYAGQLKSMIVGTVGSFVGVAGIKKAFDFVEDCTQAFNTQLNAETQLMSVLANTLDSNYVSRFEIETTADTTGAVDEINAIQNGIDEVAVPVSAESRALTEAFDQITDKAADIQSRGIYGDEAMIAAGAEFATYFSDTNAIEMMMDTLTDYAMGMSGGGEVGSQQMVNYATNLGKIMSGSYDTMTEKGFELTDTQKAIIEGTATQEQIVASLGEEYADMSSDMQAAAAISQVIEESWSGLYENMSNTPEGKIIQMTNAWGDMKETIGEQLYPALMNIIEIIESNWGNIEIIIQEITNGLKFMIYVLGLIIKAAAGVCNFISSNWDTIAPIISMAAAVFLALAVAIGVAKVAQALFNTTLFGCPLIWIMAIIIVAIVAFYALIDTINKLTDSSISATGIIAGAFLAWGACILNKTIIPLQQKFAAFANFIGNFVNDPIAAVKVLFYDMCLTVLGYISNVAHGIEDLINAIPGISVNITGGIDDLYSKIEEAQQKVKDESGWVEYVKKWDYIDITKAFNIGYDFGEKLEKDISGLFDPSDELNKLEETLNKAASIDENTGAIKDSMDITEEDLKYLRDIAEQETINRFTTAEITVEQHNTNNISSKMDLDGVIDGLTDAVDEAVFMITEGVHV